MVKLSSLRTDPVLSVQGRVVEFAKGLTFTIARANNARFERRLQELVAPHIPEINAKTFAAEDREALIRQAASETLLVGWDGLTEDDETTPIPYSPEKSLEICQKPEYGDIYSFVVMQANNDAAYRMRSLGN